MRITGYRTLTTVQEWGRPVGDANGVFADGVTSVPIIMVDTDEWITDVGFGPHVEMETIFAAIDGEDPRCMTALFDRSLRPVRSPGGKIKGGLDVDRDRHRLTLVRDVLTEAAHGFRPRPRSRREAAPHQWILNHAAPRAALQVCYSWRLTWCGQIPIRQARILTVRSRVCFEPSPKMLLKFLLFDHALARPSSHRRDCRSNRESTVRGDGSEPAIGTSDVIDGWAT
jgi:hypothetical protein